ncbi:hypothetical protein FC96_GL001184 [Secundilactobacillus kimchicus JCM 15530]|uniref:Uncharacterized protein n=1 Tax=Secundilactobacillus kimchicus JCM 15530 TaxID=1302272 RepID=A0A0R1HR03_9LACO|nr:hypothetical protein FC96_GL001184 [Secundilactobacillus kimchicus JCM 15530]
MYQTKLFRQPDNQRPITYLTSKVKKRAFNPLWGLNALFVVSWACCFVLPKVA